MTMSNVQMVSKHKAGHIPSQEWGEIQSISADLMRIQQADKDKTYEPQQTKALSASITLIEQLADIFRRNIHVSDVQICKSFTIRLPIAGSVTHFASINFGNLDDTWYIHQYDTRSSMYGFLHTDGVAGGLSNAGTSPVPYSIIIPTTGTDASSTEQTFVYPNEELKYNPETKQIHRKGAGQGYTEPRVVYCAGDILNDAAVVHSAPVSVDRLFVRMNFTGRELLQAMVTQNGKTTQARVVSNLRF